MVRMKEERLTKRSDTKKKGGYRKRGRPLLRWEDFLTRDLRKAEDEEKLREKNQQLGAMEADNKSSHTA